MKFRQKWIGPVHVIDNSCKDVIGIDLDKNTRYYYRATYKHWRFCFKVSQFDGPFLLENVHYLTIMRHIYLSKHVSIVHKYKHTKTFINNHTAAWPPCVGLYNACTCSLKWHSWKLLSHLWLVAPSVSRYPVTLCRDDLQSDWCWFEYNREPSKLFSGCWSLKLRWQETAFLLLTFQPKQCNH